MRLGKARGAVLLIGFEDKRVLIEHPQSTVKADKAFHISALKIVLGAPAQAQSPDRSAPNLFWLADHIWAK